MSDTVNLSVDLDDLTLDEIDAVESITDAPLDDLADGSRKKAKLLKALAVVVKHRESPDDFPIESADDLAASLRKVGAMRIAVESAPNPPEQPAS